MTDVTSKRTWTDLCDCEIPDGAWSALTETPCEHAMAEAAMRYAYTQEHDTRQNEAYEAGVQDAIRLIATWRNANN